MGSINQFVASNLANVTCQNTFVAADVQSYRRIPFLDSTLIFFLCWPFTENSESGTLWRGHVTTVKASTRYHWLVEVTVHLLRPEALCLSGKRGLLSTPAWLNTSCYQKAIKCSVLVVSAVPRLGRVNSRFTPPRQTTEKVKMDKYFTSFCSPYWVSSVRLVESSEGYEYRLSSLFPYMSASLLNRGPQSLR